MPIVTLPSAFLRGRITYALYRKMGVFDCVAQTAEEYVRLALTLGTNRDRRQDLRERIQAANEVLFEDHGAVRELEQFFQEVAASGSNPPAATFSRSLEPGRG